MKKTRKWNRREVIEITRARCTACGCLEYRKESSKTDRLGVRETYAECLRCGHKFKTVEWPIDPAPENNSDFF